MLTPAHLKLQNKSGTIAEGGVAQEVVNQQDKPRYYLLFQNISDTDMLIDFGMVPAEGKSILIKPGIAWETPAGIMFDAPLNVLCATTGKAFVCKIA